jgi:hypothetical protein
LTTFLSAPKVIAMSQFENTAESSLFWRKRVALVGLLMSSIGLSSLAAEKTWVSAVAGYWQVATNWVPAGVPEPVDHVVITNGQLVITQSVVIADLSVSGGVLSANDPSWYRVTNSLVWTGGTLTGRYAIDSMAAMTINGPGPIDGSWTVANSGTIVWMSGGLVIRFTGDDGRIVTVQASTNLEGWTNLCAGTVTNLIYECVDPEAAGLPHRFYRALLHP